MGLFKILRAAAVHNNKSAGGRERGEGGEGKEGDREHHGLSPKNWLLEDGRGYSQVKDAPCGEWKGEGGRAREVPAPEECADGRGIGEASVESCQTWNLIASGKDVIPLNPLRLLRRALSHATGCLSRLPQITGFEWVNSYY